MKDLIILPAADDDLVGIYNYTFDRWGLAQAENYLGEFDVSFTALCDGSAITRSAADVKPDLRKVQVGRHVVFFRETAERIEVVRVLHERMDVGRT